MGFPRAKVAQWQSQSAASRGVAPPVPAKARKKTGEGAWARRKARRKAWLAERSREVRGRFRALRLVNSNAREHYMARAARVAEERKCGFYIGCGYRATHSGLPITVTLTRYGTKLMDDDNLRTAFKGLRDGIADAFGCDDSDNGKIEWVYAKQVQSPPGCYGVRVEISSAK